MKNRTLTALLGCVFAAGWATGHRLAPQTMAQAELYRSPASGTEIRMLLHEDSLGGTEVEIAEISFPAGSNSGNHAHESTEVFYVLSGELVHVVNGERHVLKPGMLGFVRPPDEVNHITSVPTKALVIWAPGADGARIRRTWQRVDEASSR